MKTKSMQKNIPVGWDEIAVSKVFSFLKSYAISRENLINGTLNNEGISNIHYGDIHSTYGRPSINLKEVSVPLVKDIGFTPKSEDFLKNGDLIMADVSEDYAGIGVTVSVHGIDDKKVVGGLHTFVLRDVHNKTIERYRQYIFHNPNVRNKLKKIANGVSVYGISKSNLSNMQLILPPLSEQERIVEVLETWDKCIDLLDRKIVIKKNIKKGLMRQLLTGTRRLEQFAQAWRKAQIGDILKERKEKEVESASMELFSLTIEDGVCPKGERYDRSFLVKSDQKMYKKTYYNDIVYNPANLRFGAIAINKNEKPVLLSPIYKILFVKNIKEFNVDFIAHLLTWNRQIRKMSTYAEGTLIERMEVKIEAFKMIQIDVPCKSEQDAIANILNIQSKEIEILQNKRNIIKRQKKYLLNNLMAGKLRVPEAVKE